MDIISRRGFDQEALQSEKDDPIERVIHLVDALLLESIQGDMKNLADFDPFKHDEYIGDAPAGEDVQKEYAERVTEIYNSFQKQFKARDCADILGFCPFCIEIYDEKRQEWIMQGEWRQKCDKCIQYIVRDIIRER